MPSGRTRAFLSARSVSFHRSGATTPRSERRPVRATPHPSQRPNGGVTARDGSRWPRTPPSIHLPPFNPLYITNIMKYCDLFCGCGGFASGFSDAGWECALAVDNNAHALKTYQCNFAAHKCIQHDLTLPLPETHRLSRDLLEGVVCGGPPCQDFSSCGKRVLGERAQLTKHFAQHVCELMPRWTIYENVPGAARTGAFRALETALRVADAVINIACCTCLISGCARRESA